jgi:hypothetical protein
VLTRTDSGNTTFHLIVDLIPDGLMQRRPPAFQCQHEVGIRLNELFRRSHRRMSSRGIDRDDGSLDAL